jgi:flagellar assembly protein FliH
MSSDMTADNESSCQRWNLPELDESSIACPVQSATGKLDELQQQTYQEGFEHGRREGQDAGRQAMAEQAGKLEQLMTTLTRPFEDLDQKVEKELLALVFAIVRQLAGNEISANPEWILTIVREALAALPSASRNLRVYLHPEDARLVHEQLPLAGSEKQWQIVEDLSVDRGGCRVVTETSQVDATLEARLNNIITALVAGECGEDTPK